MSRAAAIAGSGSDGRSDGEGEKVRGRMTRALTHPDLRRRIPLDGEEEDLGIDQGGPKDRTRNAAADGAGRAAPGWALLVGVGPVSRDRHVAARLGDRAGRRDVGPQRHRRLGNG
jgi:hypothetical protein